MSSASNEHEEVEDDDEMDVEAPEQEEQQQQYDDDDGSAAAAVPPQQQQQQLSKTWSIKTSHVPIYTGGKLEYRNYLLFTFVNGNVCLVDAQLGIPICHVRKQQDDNDEDENENTYIDADSITSYSINDIGNTIITCSHNTILRQYSIIIHTTKTTKNNDTNTTAPDTDTTTTPNPPSDADSPASHVQKVQVELHKVWGKSGHTLPVTNMEFHLSGVFLATGSVDGNVRIWDVRGGYITHVFRPQSLAPVTAMAWYPDHHTLQLAIGRDDGSIAIHDLRSNSSVSNNNTNHQAPMLLLHDHVSAVTGMRWYRRRHDHDHDVFVTTGRDAVLNVWKVVGSKQEEKRKRNNQKSFSKKPTAVALSYKRCHTLPVYEQIEGMELVDCSMLSTTNNDSTLPLVVATAGTKGQIRLWCIHTVEDDNNNESGGASYRLKLFAEQAMTDAFGETRGGYTQLLFRTTINDDNINNNNRQPLRLLVADAEHNIAFVKIDDTSTSAHDGDDDEHGSHLILSTERTIVGHNDEVLDLKVIPNQSNNKIVVATNTSQIKLFDLSTFSCDILDRHTATVLCVDVSPCGRYVASCGKDRMLRIWHVQSLTCVAAAEGHTEAIGSTALSKKVGRYDVSGKAARNGGGAFVVTVSMDRTLKRWNLPGATDLDDVAMSSLNDRGEIKLKAFASARAHEKDINIVAIAPNDSLIATGSQDKTVKLWKATDLSQVAVLKGHRRGVWDCEFSPFDRVLATGSGDKTIKLWSLSDYSCVRTFQGHIASVLRVRFLAGGMQLVSSGADGLIKLWTVRTNESDATMDNHTDKIWALDLAPNGKELVSGGADSKITVWKDTTVETEEAKRAEEEQFILVEQKLANHLRRKEYAEALEIALKLDKPQQTLKVLTSIIDSDLEKGGNGVASLKQFAKEWTAEQITRVLRYCREWNTRARNSHVALLTIKAIVSTVPAYKLASMDGVPEIIAGIIPYAERHFERLDQLHASSYLLDFALASMGAIEMPSDDERDDFAKWEQKSKMVLPPKQLDGRVDVGGTILVGASSARGAAMDESDSGSEVITVGDTDSEED